MRPPRSQINEVEEEKVDLSRFQQWLRRQDAQNVTVGDDMKLKNDDVELVAHSGCEVHAVPPEVLTKLESQKKVDFREIVLKGAGQEKLPHFW